jgi:hypothetical protein
MTDLSIDSLAEMPTDWTRALASLEAHREYLLSLGFTSSVRDPWVGLYRQVGQRFGNVPAVPFEMVPR